MTHRHPSPFPSPFQILPLLLFPLFFLPAPLHRHFLSASFLSDCFQDRVHDVEPDGACSTTTPFPFPTIVLQAPSGATFRSPYSHTSCHAMLLPNASVPFYRQLRHFLHTSDPNAHSTITLPHPSPDPGHLSCPLSLYLPSQFPSQSCLCKTHMRS
jgi:hypothetical protein